MLSGPVDLTTVLLFAALNPASIVVALAMGAQADSLAKLPIAAFVAAIAGIALIWLLAELRIEFVAKPARAAAGMFVLGLVVDNVWAWLGYRFLKRAT